MSEPQGFPTLVSRLEDLATRRTSGVLSIKIADRSLVLHLRRGDVVRFEEGDRRSSTLLAQLVVRRGITTANGISNLLEDNPQSEVGRLLLDTKLVTAEQLADLRALQVEEVLGRLAVDDLEGDRWDPDAEPSPQPGLKPVSLLDVVRDLQRRVVEWPMLHQRLSRRERRVRRASRLPRKEKLSAREQSLVDLLKEEQTIAALLQQSWWGEFITLRTLYLLLDRHVLALEGEEETIREQQAYRRKLSTAGRGHQLTTVLLTLLAFLFSGLALWRWAPRPLPTQPVRVAEASLRRALAEQQLEKVRRCIETHRLVSSGLPADLNALVASRCLTMRDLCFPGERLRFGYQRHGELSYQLLSVPY